MLDLYETLWVPFGELLTRLEARGMPVNRPHLEQAQVSRASRGQHAQHAASARLPGRRTEAQLMHACAPVPPPPP